MYGFGDAARPQPDTVDLVEVTRTCPTENQCQVSVYSKYNLGRYQRPTNSVHQLMLESCVSARHLLQKQDMECRLARLADGSAFPAL